MKAIVAIHDGSPNHRMLAELPTATDVDRQYALSGKAPFSFNIAENDPGASRLTLKAGRMVVIQSTTGLDPYVGYIDRVDYDVERGRYEIGGDNVAAVLYDRILPLKAEFTNQGAGMIAGQLLEVANSRNPTGIFRHRENEPGTPILGTFTTGSFRLGRALDELADRTTEEWWIQHSVRRNFVQSFLRWGRERGRDRSIAIHIDEGPHFSDSQYSQDAKGAAQSVVMIGGGAAIADRPAVVRSVGRPSGYVGIGGIVQRADEPHVRDVGKAPALSRDVVELLPLDVDEPVLSSAASKALAKPLAARESFSITITSAFDWALLHLGDIVRVTSASANFGGVSRRARLVHLRPSEQDGLLEIGLEVRGA